MTLATQPAGTTLFIESLKREIFNLQFSIYRWPKPNDIFM